MTLNTAVVYGSARRDRQGIKAARFIVRQLENRRHSVDLIDTNALQLPMLDLMYKEYAEGEAPEDMESVAEVFRKADGFVVLSAEYNHSVPAALKNLLDHFQSEYLYKPSGLVTYSAGPFGGVRALVNLRGIMAELGAPSIASAFPISNVRSSFDSEGNVTGAPYDERIVKFLDEFEWYANALKAARSREARESGEPLQQSMCRNEA